MYSFHHLSKDLVDAIKSKYSDAEYWDISRGELVIVNARYQMLAVLTLSDIDDLVKENSSGESDA